ncbi:MAG: serine hydrolase [Gemmatimonadota bacterium]
MRHEQTAARFGSVVVVLLAAVACFGQEPRVAGGNWERASAAEVGLDATLIEHLVRDASGGTFSGLHAIVLVKDGKMVLDEYFAGYDSSRVHYTASISKSVASIALGIAMDQGYLDGIDEGILDRSLVELFPEYESVLTADPRKQRILLRHVLSMSAGFEWDESSYPYDDPRNDFVQTRTGDDPIGYVFEKPMVAEPGTEFNYSGGLSTVVSSIVESSTGMPMDEFAEKNLFGPLGITDYEWEHIENGLADAAGGVHMRPRDLAKLGYLFLNRGMWNRERIVSEAWVRESGKEHIVNEGNSPNYGLQWWCGDYHYAGQSSYTFFASGHGGQKVFVFPEFDMVVVLLQQVFDNPMGELNNMAIMTRYVLPSVNPAAVLSPAVEIDDAALAKYAGEYVSGQQRVTITLRDGKLYADAQDTPTLELVPLSANHFYGTVLDLVDVHFLFDVSEDGKVDGFRSSYSFSDEQFSKVPSN